MNDKGTLDKISKIKGSPTVKPPPEPILPVNRIFFLFPFQDAAKRK